MNVINCYIALPFCSLIVYSHSAAFAWQSFLRTILPLLNGRLAQIYAQLLDGIKVCPETTPHCPAIPWDEVRKVTPTQSVSKTITCHVGVKCIQCSMTPNRRAFCCFPFHVSNPVSVKSDTTWT